MDAYEVIREFIDDIHHFHNVLMIWAMHPGFLDLYQFARGVGAYPALRYRVFDEIQDAEITNPISTMVRLRQDTAK